MLGVPVKHRRGVVDLGIAKSLCTMVAQVRQGQGWLVRSYLQFPQILAPQRPHPANLKGVSVDEIISIAVFSNSQTSAGGVWCLPRVFSCFMLMFPRLGFVHYVHPIANRALMQGLNVVGLFDVLPCVIHHFDT